MSEGPLFILVLLGMGAVAGFINVVAGGGSLLLLPLLVFLGLPEGTANGTIRMGIIVQNVFAIFRYRAAEVLDYDVAKKLILPGILGAALGAAIVSYLPDASLRTILGWVMLGCAILVVAKPKSKAKTGDDVEDSAKGLPTLGRLRVWPLLFLLGVYGGMIQAGVGYLMLASFTLVLGLDLLKANVMKIVVVTSYTPIALGVFLWQGKVDLLVGLVLSIGQALGGWLGASAALKKGEGFIRVLLVVVVALSATKLLELW
ncbi:MAG: sulfite exporter TauE/SafE family protein [Deltaproteobacteria bacterium]|nr:sulfite exporter TauE/SafE family protein [Deltaproteobacteria bacterium]